MYDEMNIRRATVDDAAELLGIYAPYVERTAITFEYDVPSLDDFRSRVERIGAHFPYLVAEDGGRIVGYAYAHEFRERAAYQWNVESSIYLDMAMRHHGTGRLLYAELERQLKDMGMKNIYACISYKDEADEYLPLDSIHFHETMGYTRCGLFHKCGYKFGRWYDTLWVEKLIGEHRQDG